MIKLTEDNKKELVDALKRFSEAKHLTLLHIYDRTTSPTLIVNNDVKISDIKDDGAVYFSTGAISFPIQVGDDIEINPASIIWEATTRSGGFISRQLFACPVRVEVPETALD